MSKNNYLYLSIVTLSVLVRLVHIEKTLWFDEVGQFWISWGQNHFNSGINRLGVNEVLINNREYNLDPPLFGLLLHYWTRVNYSIVWMRMLPISLSIFSIIFFHKLVRLLGCSSRTTALATLFFSFGYSSLSYSQEVRSYSLALLITTLSTILVLRYLDIPNRINFASLTAISLVGTLTLYSYWLLLPILWLAVAISRNIRQTSVYSLSVTLLCLVVYVFQLRFQMGGFAVDYLDQFKAKSLIGILLLLVDWVRYAFGINLWFLAVRPVNATIILSLNFLFVAICFLLLVPLSKIARENFSKNKGLRILIFGYLGLLFEIIVLCLLGKFPLGGNRWNLFHTPIILAIFFGLTSQRSDKMLSLSLNVMMAAIIVSNTLRWFHEQPINHFVSRKDTYSYEEIPQLKYQMLLDDSIKNTGIIIERIDDKNYRVRR